MKKKFTRGGGAPLVLSLIALIVALAASFQEYLARFIYNIAPFDSDVEKVFLSNVAGYFTMERDSVSVITMYTEKAFIMAVIAFAAFVLFASSARKKKIVAGEAWLIIAASAACLIEPVMYMSYFFSNNLQAGFSDDLDGVKFRTMYGFLIYALPVLVSALLMLASLIVLVRLAKEEKVSLSGGETANPAQPQEPSAPVVFPTVSEQLDNSVFARPVEPMQEEMPSVQPVEEAATTEETPAAEEEPKAEEMPTAEEPKAEEMPAVQPVIEVAESVQAVFCANCGNKLDPNAKFCNNCGAKR